MPDKNDKQNLKNIVHGNITAGGNVHVGDIVHESPDFPRQLTAQFPTTPQDQIIGRKNDIEQVRQELITNQQVVLVNGIGGVGKTTLAQVYAHEYKEAYKHLAWINCLSQDFSSDVIQTANLLQNLNIDATGKDLKNLCLEVLNRLTNLGDTPCLLIIDNAESDIINYINYLPKPPNWHVLITSRQRFNVRHFKHLSLGFLSPEDAELLFLNHYKRSDITLDDIRELIRMVDYHTLTIEILAKTAQKQRSKMPELREALHTDLKTNVEIEHNDNQKIERITSYLVSIFNLSQLSTDELWLMQQFTCLPPDFHDYDILLELIQPEATKRSDIFSETLEELVDKGWLLSKENTYKMHRIIGEVMKNKIPPKLSSVMPLLKQVVKCLNINEFEDNPKNKFVWIPFGEILLSNFMDENTGDLFELKNCLAICFKYIGDYPKSKVLIEDIIELCKKKYDDKHPITAVRYSDLATILQDMGHYKDAKELLEKAVIIDEQIWGKYHATTASRYSNLATVLRVLGEYERAKSLLEEAILIDEQNFKNNDPIFAMHYSNLGIVLKEMGDNLNARKLLEKAINIDEQNFEEYHPSLAIRYSNLAAILIDMKDYNNAKSLLEKALKIDKENLGDSHPNTLIRYTLLGVVLHKIKEYDKAIEHIQRAVLGTENSFGDNHFRTARCYDYLASVYQEIGKNEDAIKLWNKAYNIYVQKIGINHQYTKKVKQALEEYKHKS